jgi:hypothetical protein
MERDKKKGNETITAVLFRVKGFRFSPTTVPATSSTEGNRIPSTAQI